MAETPPFAELKGSPYEVEEEEEMLQPKPLFWLQSFVWRVPRDCDPAILQVSPV